jgi:hypothetical protein
MNLQSLSVNQTFEINQIKQNLTKPAGPTAPAACDARARTCASVAQHSSVAHSHGSPSGWIPPARAVADGVTPRVNEGKGEGRKAMVVACHRWQLRWGHGYRRVHLTRAHLGVPLIAANVAARGDGGGHGSSWPRVGQLRRADGITALMAYPTSISIPNYI